jgi:hypothetical protein
MFSSVNKTEQSRNTKLVYASLGLNLVVVALCGAAYFSGEKTEIAPQFAAPSRVMTKPLDTTTLAVEKVHTKAGDMSMLAVLGHMLSATTSNVDMHTAYKVGKESLARSNVPAFTALASSGFEDALGAQPPLGFWDPLGLLNDADEERFDRLRTVETKHGRISMLAILGHLVTTAGVRLPGNIAFDLPFADMKTGLAAFDTIPAAGIAQIIAFIGAIEIGYSQWKESGEEWALGVFGWDAETTERKMAIELNNGRAAQMGILALMVHEKLDNNPYIINSLLGAPVPFN